MIWLTALSALIALSTYATPVDLQVHVVGPSGPIAHFPLAARYGKQVGIYAETDDSGVAAWHLDRDIGTQVEVARVGLARHDGESNDAFDLRTAAFKASISSTAYPRAVRIDLPAGQATIDQTITCPRGVVVTAGPVTNPDGSFARLVSLEVLADGFPSEYTPQTGMLSLIGVPADTTSSCFLTWADGAQNLQTMRIAIANSHSDVALGALQVSGSVTRDAHLQIKRIGVGTEWPLRAYASINAAGFTLVSSNASFICDEAFYSKAVDHIQNETLDVAPGTYYILPAMFGPYDFQSILIEKLAAGVDLSGNTALPHITIAAGETKEIEFDAVNVINAIYALP